MCMVRGWYGSAGTAQPCTAVQTLLERSQTRLSTQLLTWLSGRKYLQS